MTGDGGGVDSWEGDPLKVRREGGGEDVVGRVGRAAVGPVGERGFVCVKEKRGEREMMKMLGGTRESERGREEEEEEGGGRER